MTCPAGEATQDDPPVLHAAIGLTEQIKEASDAAEAERRLPPSIATAMQEAGIFGMVMLRAWGGPELDPLMQIRVIEALAMADGSTGWCAMIGCDSGYVSAFLDQSVARAMYPDRLVATRAAATTTGEARRASGGYRVNGRFPFVSGCHHSEWAWLGCTVVEDGVRRVDDNGVPRTLQCFLHLSECERDPGHLVHDRAARYRQQRPCRPRYVRPRRGQLQLQDPELIKPSGRSMRSRTCSSRRAQRRRLASPAGQSTR